jgi:ADP-heptose:LPS heptosyltransferase
MLLGGPLEKEKVEVVLRAAADVSQLVYVSTDEGGVWLAAAIALADVIVCGDSLVHLSSVLGVSAVALFGPTSAAEVPSCGGLVAKLSAALTWLACYSDCDRPVNCMTEIDPMEVARLVERQVTMWRRGSACGA